MDPDNFVKTHIYALIWLTGHLVVSTGIALVYNRQWHWLFLWFASLFCMSHTRFKKNQHVINFFQPFFESQCNGLTVVGLDTAEQSSTNHGPTLYCFHPHAIVANGFGLSVHALLESARNRPITIAVAKCLVWFNFAFRWFVNSYGCDITSVACDDLHKTMNTKVDVAMCPGGFEEVMLMETGKDVVYVRHRKGFIKLAINHGYKLVPIFAFGESDFYTNGIPLPKLLSKKLAHYGVPLVLPRGKAWWNFMPKKTKQGLVIVFGNPIDTSQKSIAQVHEEYITELMRIHSEHRTKTVYDRELLLI